MVARHASRFDSDAAEASAGAGAAARGGRRSRLAGLLEKFGSFWQTSNLQLESPIFLPRHCSSAAAATAGEANSA